VTQIHLPGLYFRPKGDNMIGDIVIIGKSHYVKCNSEGTLRTLPKIRWFRSLQIFWLNYWHRQTIGEVRSFYAKYRIRPNIK